MPSYTSILMNPTVKPITPTLENSTVGEDYRTGYEHILEFNEEVIMADYICANGFYKGILESGEYVLNEGVFGALSAFIQKVVYTILNFFNWIFAGHGGGKENKNAENLNSRIKKQANAIKTLQPRFMTLFKENKLAGKSFKVKKYSFGLYTGSLLDLDKSTLFADIVKLSEELEQDIKDMMPKITNVEMNVKDATQQAIDNDNRNQGEKEEDLKKSIEMNTKMNEILKNMDVKSAPEFNPAEENVDAQFIASSLNNIDFILNIDKALSRYKVSDIKALNDTLDMLKELEKWISKMPNDAKINKMKSFIAMLQNNAILNLNRINEYKNLMHSAILIQCNQVYTAMNNMLGEKEEESQTVGGKEAEEVEESYLAYTEAFSDALTSVMKDYKWRYAEIYKEGLVNEAVIYSKPGANINEEMMALDEAIGSKVKSAFNTAVAKIKEIFAKFMEKLRANVTTTRNYCNKYKKYILGTKINTNYKNTKDIINGMYSVTQYELPAFNWLNVEDKLVNASTFSEFLISKIPANRKYGTFNPTTPTPAGDQAVSQLAEYFKEYFGCAGPNIEIPGEKMQEALPDIYNFMYDISKIEKSINNSIKQVEGMREAALKQAGIEKEQPPAAPAHGSERVTNVDHNSFHYIDHIPVLLEIDTVPTQTQQTAQGQQQQVANPTGAAAMKTVAKNAQNSKGQEQYGVENTKREEVDLKLNVYIQCTTAVLKAKLTAVEFLRKEFFDVFRDIVQRNTVNDAEPAANT